MSTQTVVTPNVVTPGDWLAEYPPARSLPLDQEATRIYERAYYLGLKTEPLDDPAITFTTVLAALLKGDDETSKWFAERAASIGPTPTAVFAEKNIQTILTSTAPQLGKPEPVRLSSDKQLLTVSARGVIENADRWAQRVGGSDIGVRHLAAAYVLNPPADHRAQIIGWGYQEAEWRKAFFEWVAKRYTWEEWSDARQRPAPSRTVPAFEQQKVKASSLAFPADANALKVLEKAAEFHARRQTDPWLRLQTILFALIETARADASVQKAVSPLWTAAQTGAHYATARNDFLAPGAAPGGPLPAALASFNNLDISPRVLNVLETARELAAATLARRATGGEVKVSVLHLAGALISRRVDADDEMAALGLMPQKMRGELIQHAQSTESADVWREMLGEEDVTFTGRPVDLNSDEPDAVIRLDQEWKTDPLAIRADVESFASLLASRSLEPPLSIGLFGPWGSGKTTFLKRLRRAVERRGEEARAAGTGPTQSPYVSNVVHVEFNAWHYAEDALISSLVDAILRALSGYIKDEQKVAGLAWSEQKHKALASTRRSVEAAQAVEEAAKAAVMNAQQTLAVTRQQASANTTSLQVILRGIWARLSEELKASEAVKDSGVLEAVGEGVTSSQELKTRLETVRARPARLLSDLGLARSVGFAAMVLAVPPLVGWGVGNWFSTDQMGQLLSSVTAVVSVVALWVRSASKAVSKVDAAIAKVSDEYEQRLVQDPAVIVAQTALDAARESAETAAAGLQAARDELARAQAEVANAALPAQMLRLVTARLDDLSYGKELTTVSLARADLQDLSVILRDQRAEPGSSTPGARAVDRVILYVDDLDRCKPEEVVRVLQLVHMLLAFELFVVVVAVDARWVDQALRSSYAWLGSTDDPITPAMRRTDGLATPQNSRVTSQDYLEKIFQISFWLEPMTAARTASYLASLVRTPGRESGPGTAHLTTVAGPNGAGSPSAVSTKIEIAATELDYMRALASYVGPSPRRVKRLVNAYRLIKARMSDAQLSTFLTDRAAETGGLRSGPYQLVIGLLVIGTGGPAAGGQLLKELAEWDPRDTYDNMIRHFRSRNQSDWSMAAQVIETLMRTQKPKDVSELRGWARKVGRFLLHNPIITPASGRSGQS